jgi:hypothetical protein
MTKERRIEIELEGFKLISKAQNILLEAQITQLKPCNLVDGELHLSQSVMNTTMVIADQVMQQAKLLTSLLVEQKNGQTPNAPERKT